MRQAKNLDTHKAPVRDVAYHADTWATCGDDKQIILWEDKSWTVTIGSLFRSERISQIQEHHQSHLFERAIVNSSVFDLYCPVFFANVTNVYRHHST